MRTTAHSVSSPALTAEVIEFGPSPVVQYVWPDSEPLNAGLKKAILDKMTSSHGVIDTNVGGWHSERNLPSWNDPSIAALIDRVRQMARQLVAATVSNPLPEHLENWKIEGWANVNRRGAFNKSHHHAGGQSNRNVWSGIYYVDEGGRGQDARISGGLTRFEDRSGAPKEILRCPDPFERELTLLPQAGLMVFFPATLRHYVTPYQGDGDRITIALNLKHDHFIIPRYADPEAPFLWRNFRGPMTVLSTLKRMVRGKRPEY